jgi:hypothetical protein
MVIVGRCEAGLPDGSTSSCFRSRSGLLKAVVARLEDRDLATLTSAPQPDATSMSAVAAHLAGLLEGALVHAVSVAPGGSMSRS